MKELIPTTVARLIEEGEQDSSVSSNPEAREILLWLKGLSKEQTDFLDLLLEQEYTRGMVKMARVLAEKGEI